MKVYPPKIESDFEINAFDIKQIPLSNGMSCFTINNLNTDIVKFNIVFLAGTKYGNAAVIKLLCRIIFDGSKQYKGDSFAEKIDRKGAYVFSKPNADRIIFTLVCQKKDFEELLPVFLDAVFHPELSNDNVKSASRREMNSLSEAFQYNTTIADETFIPSVLGDQSPYSQVLRPDDYNNITRNELISFHEKYINSDNGYVLLSGEIDENIKQSLLPLEELTGNGFLALPIQLKGFVYKPVFRKIVNPYSSQSYLLLGNQTITKGHPDYINFKIVSTLLGGYIGSRLMQNIREKSGYTYDIYSSLSSNEQVAMFRIASEIQKGKEDEVLKEIENEIFRLKDEPVLQDELNRLKNYMTGELLSSFDGMFARDGAFLSVHNFGLDLSFYNKFQKSIRDLNSNVIQSIANKYLTIDLYSKIIVVPE